MLQELDLSQTLKVEHTNNNQNSKAIYQRYFNNLTTSQVTRINKDDDIILKYYITDKKTV